MGNLMIRRTKEPGKNTVWIGPDIRITVTEVDGKFVSLGIKAPASYDIAREELMHFRTSPQVSGQEGE